MSATTQAHPRDPVPTRPRRFGRRLALIWTAFVVATLAVVLAVYHLYGTVTRELEEQGRRAMGEELAKARERMRLRVEDVQLAIIARLAALHVEGLAHALREWDDADATVAGTFQWDAEKGFSAEPGLPAGAAAELTELWSQFQAWRRKHPGALESGSGIIGPYHARFLRTIDNPSLAHRELGYQGENLEMLAYASRPVDPWAGRAVRIKDASFPWVFWYQAGPDSPVRGCFVDFRPFLGELRKSLADSQLARIDLTMQRETSAPEHITRVGLAEVLPGFALVASPGDLFLAKQGGVHLAAAGTALLLGGFVILAAILINYSRREAQDAERKATFLTLVSHELRTPLTSIQMFADMLAAPGLSEEKRDKYAGTISRESRRLGGLIERLLTFNAVQQGKQTLAVAQVDVATMVRETLEEMEGTFQGAEMQVETELPTEPVVVPTDRSTVKQALLNLLDNALKYARSGKVVRISLVTRPHLVSLQVADAGPGVSPGLGDQLFEPFVQGTRTLTDKSPGVGLGLSIARGSLRNVGGDLVRLPSAHGAVFEIRLPRPPAS